MNEAPPKVPGTPSKQGEASALAPEALDFAPGLLSIQESPPARLPRVVLYAVSALFAILLVWAIFGKLDIIASAEGRLVPETYVKIVQPADAGIVEDILVKEGEAVSAGEVLMRMDTKIAEADARAIQAELQTKRLTLRRIDAELAGAPLLKRNSDPNELFGQIASQYRAHRQAYLDAIAQENEVLNKARHDLVSAEAGLTKLRQVVPLYQRTAAAFEKLGQEGFAGQVMVDEKVRDRIEKEQDMKSQEATVVGLKAAIAQSEMRLAQITSNYRSQLQNERVETETQYQKIEQDWAKAEYKTSLLELKAPQAGIIKDLATHTKGTVVSPGTVLMTIVPHDEPLQAEVLVKNEDVGFVYPRQKVKIKLAAYPFQKYGLIDGEVIHLGADANDDNSSNAAAADKGKDQPASSTLNYKALVKLNTQTLERDGEQLKLAPGMQVVAEIHQGRRTVMEYLLSPVQKAFHDAGRER